MPFLYSLFILFGLSALLSFFGKHYWVFDLLTHFQIQYVLISIIFFVVFLHFGKWDLAALSIIICILVVTLIWKTTYTYSAQESLLSEDPIQIATYNKFYKNENPEKIITWIKSYNDFPDILVIHEISLDEIEILQHGLSEYLFHAYTDEQTNARNRSLILSKIPITSNETVILQLKDRKRSVLKATLKTSKHNAFSLYAFHPKVPIPEKGANTRNREFVELAEYIKDDINPILFAGDFNATVYTPYFQNFLASTGLKYASHKFGFIPTWPSHLLLPFLQIQIDHILLSEEFTLGSIERGPSLGSDHYPLVATVELKEAFD